MVYRPLGYGNITITSLGALWWSITAWMLHAKPSNPNWSALKKHTHTQKRGAFLIVAAGVCLLFVFVCEVPCGLIFAVAVAVIMVALCILSLMALCMLSLMPLVSGLVEVEYNEGMLFPFWVLASDGAEKTRTIQQLHTSLKR